MKLDNRIWVLLTVIVSGAILAGAWFLGASPFLAAAATSAESAASVNTQNDATTAEIADLKASRAKLTTLSTRLGELRGAVPNSVDGTSFITEINSIAAETGVSVVNIALNSPVAYAPPAAAATAAVPGTAATPTPTASASAEASAAATPAPVATGPTAPVPATDPLVTSSNFIVVPVTVAVKGSADASSAFLRGIQHGKRLFLVTDLATTSGSDGEAITMSGSIYVLKSSSTTSAAANG